MLFSNSCRVAASAGSNGAIADSVGAAVAVLARAFVVASAVTSTEGDGSRVAVASFVGVASDVAVASSVGDGSCVAVASDVGVVVAVAVGSFVGVVSGVSVAAAVAVVTTVAVLVAVAGTVVTVDGVLVSGGVTAVVGIGGGPTLAEHAVMSTNINIHSGRCCQCFMRGCDLYVCNISP